MFLLQIGTVDSTITTRVVLGDLGHHNSGSIDVRIIKRIVYLS
jgi:hypothetical protein